MLRSFLWTVIAVIPSVWSNSLAAAEKADLIIRNGYVLTMDEEMRAYEYGAVAIRDGKILAVGESTAILKAYRARKKIDARGHLVMPGLVNTHSHATMTLFRGIADDAPLKQWLEEYIWPIEAKFVTPANVRIGTDLAIAEMIKSGTTTFNDMYFFMEQVAQAANTAGIRTVIAETVIDVPTPFGDSPAKSLEEIRRLAKVWKDHPLVTVAIGPHAPYTLQADTLRACASLANELDLPIHIHVAETQHEDATIRKKYTLSPARFLDSLGLIGPRTIAAHGVFLDERDRRLLSEKSAGVAHNPESNMKLGSGRAPVIQLLKLTDKVGIGSDGAASNNNLDLFEEMGSAAKLQKLSAGSPSAISAQAIVYAATMGGAKVLGLDQTIGSLEEGKAADLILINLDQPHLTPMYDPYSHLVFAVGGRDVATVLINGQIVMKNRQLKTLDEEAIKNRARAVARNVQDFLKTRADEAKLVPPESDKGPAKPTEN